MPGVKDSLRSSSLPIPKKIIHKVYIFGSSIKKTEYNDIDIALMIDPMSPVFDDSLSILQVDIGKVQYHLLPDYPWFKKRLDESSDNIRLSKKYLPNRSL